MLFRSAVVFAGLAAVCMAAALVLVVGNAQQPEVLLVGKTQTLVGGLQIETIKDGSGATAATGDNVKVQYSGKLANGKVFDSGDISFPLGAGHVIKGWDLGVNGMKVGEERKLIIPASLGYGATGTPGGPIPPNAQLTFDVKLLKVDN